MMKPLTLFALAAMLGLSACNRTQAPLIDTHFTDSLVVHYQESPFEKLISNDLSFWKNRVDSQPGSFTALTRYSGGLIQRFHLYGNMADLLKADSILQVLDQDFKGKEAGVIRSMASLNITRHRFTLADTLVEKALALGGEKYASVSLYFDTKFELGAYLLAGKALRTLTASNEYGYFFRLSRWKHLEGETDSAVYYMQKAADWSGNSLLLKQTALSNMADLYMHEGQLKIATQLYTNNLIQNIADYHSWQGLGRIMLMKDNDPAGAEKLFRFIAVKNQLPDTQFNLVWVAEQKEDTVLQKEYASAFVAKATESWYVSMYNKYLIDLYTGILNRPCIALALAEKEITNRPTPQTYAWLVWALHKTGQDTKAWEMYKTHVSGKPLEALELYWIGKMMKDMGKNYNATEFFKAASKNLYDLSPVKQKNLKSLL